MKKGIKKLLVLLLTAAVMSSAAAVSASACASLYVGAALTEDGSAIVARSEDLGGSIDKLFYYREDGAFRAGEEYRGCYGFTWTFTHDSYAYTAFRDDNGDGVDGVCPDCGSTEENHVPYEEAGTNEKGLTVTATETLFPNTAIDRIDPLVDDGIAESEIPTVLLSECASAREAVELLLDIYDTRGAAEANGLFIADAGEIWYIENLTGHHYIALLLPEDLAFIEMNISVIGRIDLDDTAHVIASDGLIEAAEAAGTFVGDADENIIDFRNSCSDAVDFPGYGSRTIEGLNFLCGEDRFTEENTEDRDLVISNVDESGALVSLYTNIVPEKPFSLADAVDFYKVSPIGRPSNQETHIFQIYPDASTDPELGTVEWVSMGNDRYTVFVPHLPMLLTDTYEGYRVSTAAAEFASDEPGAGRAYYPDTEVAFLWDGESMDMEENEGFRVLPENWRDSVYWAFDAVAERITSGAASEADEARVVGAYADAQQGIYTAYTDLRIAMDETPAAERPALATESGAAMARDAHRLALELYDSLTAEASGSGE